MSASTVAPCTGRLARVCMYCHETYGYLPCAPEQDGRQSHGICHALACRERAAAQFEVPLSFFDRTDGENSGVSPETQR